MLPFVVIAARFWLLKLNIIEMVVFALGPISFFFFKDYALFSMLIFNGIAASMHLIRYLKSKNKKGVLV